MPDPQSLPDSFSATEVSEEVSLPTSFPSEGVKQGGRFQIYNELSKLTARAAVGALAAVGFIVLLMVAKGTASDEIKNVLESLQPFVLPLVGALAGYAIASSDGGNGGSE